MRSKYIHATLFASIAFADVLTTINGNTCTLRSSVIIITAGEPTSTASRTGGESAPTSGTASGATTGVTSAPTDSTALTLTNSRTADPGSSTPTSTSAEPTTTGDGTPLPAPSDTNANGVDIYTDRAVCGAIYKTSEDPDNFYAIYCNTALLSNTVLDSFTEGYTFDTCVQACTRYGDSCQGAVYYNGTSSTPVACTLYGASSSSRKRTVDSTLSLVYAQDSYSGFSMATADSFMPPAPAPGQTVPPTATVTSESPTPPATSSTSTVSGSPTSSANSTAMRFVMKPRNYMKPKHAMVDLSYIH